MKKFNHEYVFVLRDGEFVCFVRFLVVPAAIKKMSHQIKRKFIDMQGCTD